MFFNMKLGYYIYDNAYQSLNFIIIIIKIDQTDLRVNGHYYKSLVI